MTVVFWLSSYYDTALLPHDVKDPVVLWWSPFVGDENRLSTCEDVQCYFTQNKSFTSHLLLKAILFYGSNFNVADLPLPRSRNVTWGLIHEESPRNNPILVHDDALNLFNYSATFSRYSDVPLTLVDLPGEEELTDTSYLVPFKEKSELVYKNSLAPVLYIQSDCDTASDRDSYVAELMKYIQVDSYGPCLNNRPLVESLKDNHMETLMSKEFLSFVAKYKFTLAFENAVCNDYITEKLWRPLIVGSIPVYYGSPTFKDWLPNNQSAISVLDFKNPKDLAAFLLKLANNEADYQEYLNHKLLDRDNRITNDRLLKALQSRPKGYANDFGNYVQAFECFVCRKVHNSQRSLMTSKQYSCPLPTNPLTGKINHGNVWVDQWNIEKCGAKLLAHFVSNNKSIDIKQFNNEQFRMYNKAEC
ncbi:alpha-(1,3)-fucosyltransferase 10 isoform X2 [Cephus cinctus]|uniref:Fucosyltransferase n=1 Tax=Cephus cinctus TaxID=211228 RepID=A0AAJ7RDA8_CEPCN|nr:alpha-(1,3)-fucosyltransferase 10 isoform X2 [Cephus cinctus]